MSSVTSSSNRCDGNFPERILWATIHRMSARLRSRAMQCTTIILYMFSEYNAKKKKISCASQHTHSRSSRIERFIENTSCMHNAYTEFCSVGPAIQCPATQQTILIVLCTYAISKMQFQNATAPPIQTHICDHIRFSYMVWSHMHFQIFIKKKIISMRACNIRVPKRKKQRTNANIRSRLRQFERYFTFFMRSNDFAAIVIVSNSLWRCNFNEEREREGEQKSKQQETRFLVACVNNVHAWCEFAA